MEEISNRVLSQALKEMSMNLGQTHSVFFQLVSWFSRFVTVDRFGLLLICSLCLRCLHFTPFNFESLDCLTPTIRSCFWFFIEEFQVRQKLLRSLAPGGRLLRTNPSINLHEHGVVSLLNFCEIAYITCREVF